MSMEPELLVTLIIIGFGLVAVIAGFVAGGRIKSSLEQSDVPAPPLPLSWPFSLKWLLLLTTAVTCLLLVQVIFGTVLRSLVLLADAAHGAADVATYSLAAFVEYMKYNFGQHAVSAGVGARMDMASAAFFVLIVMATSITVCVEGANRLRHGAQEEHANHDDRLGEAMLIVAGLGLFLNLGLLTVHFWRPEDERGGDREASSPLLGRGQKNGKSFCAPAFNQRQRGAIMGTLHATFHPGCTKEDHATGGAGKTNLNVYGVLLHIWTDVARTTLMVVVGILVRFRLVSEPWRVDAICAFVICGFVMLGSTWLIIAATSMDAVSAACGVDSEAGTKSKNKLADGEDDASDPLLKMSGDVPDHFLTLPVPRSYGSLPRNLPAEEAPPLSAAPPLPMPPQAPPPPMPPQAPQEDRPQRPTKKKTLAASA